jgi:ABC-2 type transport system permease protein
VSAGTTYLRFELLRTLRNRRIVLFSLGFPLVLYLLIAGPNRDVADIAGTGVPAAAYFMVGLLSFGGMNAMLASGARIAAERTAGWNRQLRITPLRPAVYLRVKVVTAYALVGLTIAVLYTAGAALGVRFEAARWVEMTALILCGLAPFAAMGILLGHMVTADSAGPAVGGAGALFAFLGGAWFPITDGFLQRIGELLPSYWIVQAGRAGAGGASWSVKGWIVVAAWTLVAAVLAARAYRRDTGRA